MCLSSSVCVHFELRHLRLFPLLLLVSLWLILAHASPLLLFSSFAASIPTPDEMFVLTSTVRCFSNDVPINTVVPI